jgi:acyl-coenzyme A thioesterase PaaI-like protein
VENNLAGLSAAPTLPSAGEFLGGRSLGEGRWTFSIGADRHGAFGGAFGGLLAACCVHAARPFAPERVPTSVDARFLRGVGAGDVMVVASLLHSGRSLSGVNVDVFDARERLCTRTLVYLVDRQALQDRSHHGPGGAQGYRPWSDGKPWPHPPGLHVPIIDTFQPRFVGRDERGEGAALPVPWEPPSHGAEAVCLAADISVGGPVAAAFPGKATPAPNPDLSVRILSDVSGPDVAAFARLERIDRGVAAVRMEIWSGANLVGIGMCSSLLVDTQR